MNNVDNKELPKYDISYEYYDKKRNRQTRTITYSSLDRTIEEIGELKKRIGQPGGPISMPQVVMYRNGEIKIINNLK